MAYTTDDDRTRPGGRSLVAGVPRDNRIQWGPIWAGLVTALATFVLLQLTFFATDLVDLDVNPGAGSTDIEFWTAVAAIASFLLGGIVTAASTKWEQLEDGLLHGIVMWAAGILALVVVSQLAAGSISGTLGRTVDDIAQIATGADDNAVEASRDRAANAVLFLGLTVAASSIGAFIGTKIWPRRSTPRPLEALDHGNPTDVTDRGRWVGETSTAPRPLDYAGRPGEQQVGTVGSPGTLTPPVPPIPQERRDPGF